MSYIVRLCLKKQTKKAYICVRAHMYTVYIHMYVQIHVYVQIQMYSKLPECRIGFLLQPISYVPFPASLLARATEVSGRQGI